RFRANFRVPVQQRTQHVRPTARQASNDKKRRLGPIPGVPAPSGKEIHYAHVEFIDTQLPPHDSFSTVRRKLACSAASRLGRGARAAGNEFAKETPIPRRVSRPQL